MVILRTHIQATTMSGDGEKKKFRVKKLKMSGQKHAFIETMVPCSVWFAQNVFPLLKKSNIKRHFETHHAAFAAKYPVGESRKKACAKLQCKLQAGWQQLQAWTGASGSLNAASFACSLEIARQGKPFTDGEYVKSCMLITATELFADFQNKSAQTESQDG